MSLLKTETTNANNSASLFEDDDTMTTTDTTTTPTPAATALQVAQPVQTAVGLPQARPLPNVLEPLKNAMRVEYNTLESVIANQGNFMSRETKKSMGDEVTFELLSFQDSYVVSPGDDKAPAECVKYSDDGLTCSDGTAVAEHLHWLKTNGYPKASVKPRVVLVGAIEKTAKPSDLLGTLVQFDLSPVSRTHWMRYMANSAFLVRGGRYTAEQLTHVKATAETAVNGTNTFTLSRFSVAN